MNGWTYGAEHELVNWSHDRLPDLPRGVVLSPKEYTIVNDNGIATDPSGKLYRYGGELNTPGTDTPLGQADLLSDILRALPDARVNYRCCLHVHVRVPGLREDLPALKKVQAYFVENAPRFVLPMAKLPTSWADISPLARAHLIAKRKMRATVPGPRQAALAAEAETLGDFYAAEAPRNKRTGAPMPHATPRAAVNLRQLHQSDTVEFRHYAPTLDPKQVLMACSFARDFLWAALNGQPFDRLGSYLEWDWPTTPEWNERAERGYLLTNHDGSLRKREIAENIDRILSGTIPL